MQATPCCNSCFSSGGAILCQQTNLTYIF
ncbi:MAG TPA: hypothetical protein ENJ95_20905 [Bacteroidetes bacterium]|nr:hypothetical protein [Bacteroidota bacterium]